MDKLTRECTMLRVIKFWGNYNDIVQFSNCSTEYEVLPIVFEDTATERELMEVCLSNNIQFKGIAVIERPNLGYHDIKLKAAIELTETKLQNTGVYISGKMEARKVYLGLVTIPKCKALPIHEGVDKLVTEDQAYNIINNQECSVAYTADVDGEHLLVMEDWDYFHSIKFLGYSLESFENSAGTNNNRTFSDEVTSCNDCGEYMWESNGHNYNYRIVDDCTLLGIKCGCYEAHALNNIEEYVDDSSKAVELKVAEKLSEQGKLKFVERYISGMVDPGRGGYYAGYGSVSNGQPEEILAALKLKYPKHRYVFSHDESGQFQTYFSVWRVPAKGGRFKTK
jgi:hypothetical protein